MAFPEGWKYRRKLEVDSASVDKNRQDVVIRLYLDNTKIDFSKLNNDGSDVRFTDAQSCTLLPYWIELWDSVNQKAIVWIKVPQVSNSSNSELYMYYGNVNASSADNGKSVFMVFDDFTGTTLDTSLWAHTTNPNVNIQISNSELQLTTQYNQSSQYGWVQLKQVYENDLLVIMKINKLDQSCDGNIQTNSELYMYDLSTDSAFYSQASCDTSAHFRLDGRVNGDWGQIPMVEVSRSSDTNIFLSLIRTSDNTLRSLYSLDGISYTQIGNDVSNFPKNTVAVGTGVWVNTSGYSQTEHVDYMFITSYTESTFSILIKSEEPCIVGTMSPQLNNITLLVFNKDTYDLLSTSKVKLDGSYIIGIPTTQTKVLVVAKHKGIYKNKMWWVGGWLQSSS